MSVCIVVSRWVTSCLCKYNTTLEERHPTVLITHSHLKKTLHIARKSFLLCIGIVSHQLVTSIDVTSPWREDWQSATVVNSTLVVDPTIRLPGFDLHRRQWSLLNRFWTGQGHCNACHKKLGFTDNELCDCGEIQTMSHIVNSCPLTKFDGGLLRLHEADEAAVDWLTTHIAHANNNHDREGHSNF